MRREEKIIEANRCLGGFGMSVCVLRANRGRVHKTGCRDGIATEAEDIEGGEVYSETQGGFAEVIGDGLWVEGRAPVKGRCTQCLLRPMGYANNTYQLRKYIHPSTREVAFANASSSLSVMVECVA
jgi:hypothetical protein